jgi:pyridoxamine 5'-phosphate oxidase family protein
MCPSQQWRASHASHFRPPGLPAWTSVNRRRPGIGQPHVVPLGWHYNPDRDTIDISGRDFARTRKFRNVQGNPNVALVIDDVLPAWRPRCVMIRGRAEALPDSDGPQNQPADPIIRLHPTEVISWGMEFAAE